MTARNKGGRPTLMTPETISKLEDAFSWGCSDEEACLHAGIGKSTLYNFQEVNPQFVERKEELKETPVLKARMTAVKKVTESYSNAMDYLKRKKKLEFGDNVDHTSAGKPIAITFDRAFASSPETNSAE